MNHTKPISIEYQSQPPKPITYNSYILTGRNKTYDRLLMRNIRHTSFIKQSRTQPKIVADLEHSHHAHQPKHQKTHSNTAQNMGESSHERHNPQHGKSTVPYNLRYSKVLQRKRQKSKSKKMQGMQVLGNRPVINTPPMHLMQQEKVIVKKASSTGPNFHITRQRKRKEREASEEDFALCGWV